MPLTGYLSERLGRRRLLNCSNAKANRDPGSSIPDPWERRAGVEKVMGFCTDGDYQRFLEDVLPFEHMLIAAGIQIIKYYLDISKKEQEARLKHRREDPLSQWKRSPIDEV